MNQSKNILLGSGSSTKISFMYGRAQKLMRQKKYDTLIGTSGTAILFPLMAVEKDYEIDKLLFSGKSLDEIYFDDKPFFFKNGKMKINMWNLAWKLITKQNSISTTKKFEKLYRSIFTREDFESLKERGVTVYVCSASINTKRALYVNNLEYTYDEFIKGVVASSNMPIATDPIRIRDSWVYDGGLVDHFAGALAAKLRPESIDAILSRPQRSLTFSSENTAMNTDEDWQEDEIEDLGDAVLTTLKIFNNNVSLDDEGALSRIAELYGIEDVKIYYAPYVLTDEIYSEFDLEEVKEWYQLGLEDDTHRQL